MTDLRAFAASALVGGLWNVASLWMLTRVLGAWMGPRRSARRAAAWMAVKLLLLYPLAVLFLLRPGTSPLGFGVGFTMALAIGILCLARWAQRAVAHGP